MAFVDFFNRRLSWHYIIDAGEDLFAVLSAHLDDAMIAAKVAVHQRLLTKCLDEALPSLGQNYNLDWPARFTPAQIRAYIGDPWEHWEDAGT